MSVACANGAAGGGVLRSACAYRPENARTPARSFDLGAEDATWRLSIEGPMPIFAVAVVADVAVDLVEVRCGAL